VVRDVEVLTWMQLARIEVDILCDELRRRPQPRPLCAGDGREIHHPDIALHGTLCAGGRPSPSCAWDESIAMLEEALLAATSGTNRMVVGWVRAELAKALLGRGNLDRAEHEAQTAVTVAQAQHSRCDEIRAQLALAHTQFHRTDAAALAVLPSRRWFRAQELIDETSARAYQPEVHECRAYLARLRGDAPAARRELEEARRLYAEMGATMQAERLAKEMDG